MNERCYIANPAIPRRPQNPWCYELALTESELAIHESVTKPLKRVNLELASQTQTQEELTPTAAPGFMSSPVCVLFLFMIAACGIGFGL